MEIPMLFDELWALKRKKPFEPFCVRSTEGDDYEAHESTDFLIGSEVLVVLIAGSFHQVPFKNIESIKPVDPSHEHRKIIRERLKAFLRAAPFQPLCVFLAGNETLNIEWPEEAMLTSTGLFVARRDSPNRYALSRITAVVPKEQASA